MDEATRKALRALPAVEELLQHARAATLLERYPRSQVVEAVRSVLRDTREALVAAGDDVMGAGATAGATGPAAGGATGSETRGGVVGERITTEDVLERASRVLESWSRPGLRKVLNLSGVVVHTNLGRSRLAADAVRQVVEVARSYSTLEYDLEQGDRGRREVHVEELLKRLTGAEDAFAVNNNAGAVLLLLMGLASGREVLVSRGQLVEIGGSFRMPDIMRAGGVHLVEVGTTNRTRPADYESAITPDTAMLLRVHTSNYRILGFTEETELSDLVEIGRRHGLLVVDDLGSGALLELDAFRGEPTVASSLRSGVDLVCFSGDKLMGGPQAGILLGRGEVVQKLRRHPVARALRLDKMTLAALEATLLLYQDPERAQREIPTLQLMGRDAAETVSLASALQAAIEARCPDGYIVEVLESTGRAGGGSMPLVEIPSHAVRLRVPDSPPESGARGGSARPVGVAGGPGGRGVPTGGVSALEAELRRAPIPVVARVSQDSLHLDVLALDAEDVGSVAESVAWATQRLVSGDVGAAEGTEG